MKPLTNKKIIIDLLREERKWNHVNCSIKTTEYRKRVEEKKQRIRVLDWGFPGGAVVESLPANAGETGLSPGLGRSHMPWSNKARVPQLLSLLVWSLCSATRAAATVRGPRTAMKSGPCSPQLEKAHAQKRRPKAAKNKTNK